MTVAAARALVLWGVMASCGHPGATTPANVSLPDASVAAVADAPPKPTPVPPADCSAELVGLDLEETHALLEREHCNGNAFDGWRSALMNAADQNRADVVAALLVAGADVNFRLPGPNRLIGSAEVGQTALWFAVFRGHAAVVAQLLRAGADPNLYPPEGVPLLLLAALDDSVEIARLLVEAGIDLDQQSWRGSTVMTFGNGPSARMFEYLTTVGVAPDGLTAEQIDSLRWEAAHEPPLEATVAERVAFWIEVMQRTRSARAREDAIQNLREVGAEARSAVPALLAVVAGKELSTSDSSRVYAPNALLAFGWSSELDAALPKLLAMIAPAPAQVRIAIVELIAGAGPASRPVVDALVKLVERGPDPFLGARAFGILLARDVAIDARSLRKIEKALKKATAKSPDAQVRELAAKALQLIAEHRGHG